jgi:hypothetical protein
MTRALFSEGKMRILLTAALFSALALGLSPATAKTAKTKMAACTAGNVAKAVAAMKASPTPANKELAAANAAMGTGKMKDACAHYYKAQKLSMAK